MSIFKTFHRVFSDSVDGLKDVVSGLIRFIAFLLLFLIFVILVPFTLPLEIYLECKDKTKRKKETENQ